MPLPPDLAPENATGDERTSVIQPQADGTNKRFLFRISSILAYARRVSPTVKSIALSSAGGLTYTRTDGNTTDLGSVKGPPGASVAVGNGPPAATYGAVGDLYVDALTGDLYRKDI